MSNRDTMPQAKIGCLTRLLEATECGIRFRSTVRYPAASKRAGRIDRKASRQDSGLAFYCVVQVNNAFNNPLTLGAEHWVAYPRPQVVLSYYNGRTGDLVYVESIHATRP